ncbi:MAG: Crp/Fnr family transcriptional regulator [Actinobacteria bacterium]|nr:Crp/Fnr family transcriptional regulator [Actinomycetota bacterium]
MDHAKAAELLRQTRLFRELDDLSLQKLAERATLRTYSKGQLIFHQGDLAGSLFIIKEGSVKVFVTSEDGDEMLLVTLRPPDTFGELSLLDGSARSASAETLEQTTVLELNRATFLEVVRSSPNMPEALLVSMSAVLRRLTEQASDLVFLDLHGRVAKLLMNMAEAQGRPANGEIELDLKLTQTDIAAMVGGSRQSINQILKSFEERGYLEVRGRTMVLKQPDRLKKRAGL